MNNIIEICCGSYYDARQASLAGASRIELNSALFLGGLTPSLGALIETKMHTSLEIICMVRPRGGGFSYSEEDISTMFIDAKTLLDNGADGIAFGFLHENKTIEKNLTQRMCKLIHSYNKTAVFHRAIDICENIDQAMLDIINCGCNRVLTSGGKTKAIDAIDTLKQLQKTFSNQIEILVGSGVNEENAHLFIQDCNINQIHSSCKNYFVDPTTSGENLNFQYLNNNTFDVVDIAKVESLLNKVKKIKNV